MDPALKAIIDRAVADGVSDEDIDLLVQEHKSRMVQAPPKSAVPENLGFLGSIKHALANSDPVGRDTVPQITSENAGEVFASHAALLPMYAAPAASKVLPAIPPSLMGGAIGGVSGLVTGGIPGALAGAVTGAAGGGAGGKAVKWLRGMRGNQAASKAMTRGMSSVSSRPVAEQVDLDGKLAALRARLASQAPTTAPSAPTAKSFADEVTKRIDWRITDAVPIDAIKRDLSRGGSIIEAGESQVGLAERMAAAMKAKNIEEAARLAAAIRQRGHITARTTR